MTNITFGDMAEALYQLRQNYGFLASISEQEILDRAIQNKQSQGEERR